MTDFEALYLADPDPWSVATAWYERRKRALLMAALPRERYGHALELGCGTGATTCLLAQRCNAVHAIDQSPTAIACCTRALDAAGQSNVRLHVAKLPGEWPIPLSGQVDLILMSELAYYFAHDELNLLIQRGMASLADGGDWLMCHYKKPFHDRLQDTDRIHKQLGDMSRLSRIVAHDDGVDFRLDVWRKLGEPTT